MKKLLLFSVVLVGFTVNVKAVDTPTPTASPSPTSTATPTPIVWGKVPRGTDISTNTGWHITDGKLTPPTPTPTPEDTPTATPTPG